MSTAADFTTAADSRLESLRQWLRQAVAEPVLDLQPVSVDASFRRHFRAQLPGRTVIVMDAPPDKEDCRQFIKVAGLLHAARLHAPEILAQDLAQGFLLLSDLGTRTYLDVLNNENAASLFRDAVDALILWQLASRPEILPSYDEALLRRELDLFPEWYVGRHLKLTLTSRQQQILTAAFTSIIRQNLSQPRVFVHRDYMPRNLMVSDPNPGIIDFQDAVYGPVTYDVISLFKDAFISWEEEQVLDWVIRYWEKARKAGLPVPADFGEYYRDLEWMGLQRHLKVLGIFARIHHRDGKPRYLSDTPRFVNYVRHAAARYSALTPLLRLLDELEKQTALNHQTT
ncbi:MAG TPA: phosphotransferase [Gammaproteobacteria bacterium]|nr:phosphotransferase [Gammaproteobacteria bacterium]